MHLAAYHPARRWRVVGLSLVVGAVAGTPSVARASTSVPASIDATGHHDVTTQLDRLVARTPDGTTIVFPRHARYRIDGTLQWIDRTGLTIDGNGATLVAGTHGGPNRALVRLLNGRRWTIRDLDIVGSDPSGGHFIPGYQWQHGIDLRGVDGAVIRDVRISHVFGDDIYVGMSTTSPAWSRDVQILNSSGARSGRMSIAITAGRNVTVRGGRWSKPGLDSFDIEPNGRPGGADHVRIVDAEVSPAARAPVLTIAGRGPVSNVTLRDDRIIGEPLTVHVDQVSGRPRNVTIEDNVSTVAFTGPAPAPLRFDNTDGVVVRGNRQPLRANSHLTLVATEGATHVTIAGSTRNLHPNRRWLDYVVIVTGAALLMTFAIRRLVRRRTGGKINAPR